MRLHNLLKKMMKMEEMINIMIETENKFVYATLILRGKGLNPQEITDSTGLSPSMSFKKGDYRNKSDKWKHNYWSLSSRDKIQSSNLFNHIEWLMNQIEPVKAKFLDIVNNKDISAEISCFWILPTNNEQLILKPELLNKIGGLGLQLNLDIYGS